MEAIIVQGCDERIDLYTRIVDAFTQAAAPDGTLSHDDVNNCFFHVDPLTTQGTVIDLCKPDPLVALRKSGENALTTSFTSGACATSTSEDAATAHSDLPQENTTVPLSLLIERLQEVSIQREPAFE